MSKKKKPLKSKCCNADVNVKGMEDFDQVCTMYSECTKCHLPCDIIIKERRTWKINPKTRVVPNKKKDNKQSSKFWKEEDY